MATIPTVVANELIESAWGNTVAGEVNNQCVKKTGNQVMTGGLTAQTLTSVGGATIGAAMTVSGQLTVPAANINAGVPPTDVGVGTLMRSDGVILSTINDPTPLATANMVLQRTGVASGVGGQFARFCRLAGGAVIGSITIVSGPGTAYNTTSDRRLKTVVGPIPDPLDVIGRLRPVVYEWIDPEFAGVEHRGFLADEVQTVEPDAVTGDPDAVDDDGNIVPQQLDVSRLVPVLVAAVQALAARVDELESR